MDIKTFSKETERTMNPISNSVTGLNNRSVDLANQGLNVSLLLNATMGMVAEGGEFQDIVKKVMFHDKEYDKDTREHMLKELGDVAFYLVTCIRALDGEPEEVLLTNIEKLKKRFPDGWDTHRANNKEVGDI